MAMLKHNVLALALISFGLVGCSSLQKPVLPESGKTMLEIYDQHSNEARLQHSNVESARVKIGRSADDGENDLAGYVRDAQTEISALFPRLPNPTLVMFIYPHLSGEGGNPVPGYSTSFPMYERDQYALPGE